MQPSSMSLIESIRSYPPSVFFMLGNEFCERFSFYGMKAILVLYLVTEHQLSDSQASFAYHLFVSIAYLTPLIGSIAADNYFGRFRVILWVSIIYCIGHLLLSIGAIPGIDSILIIDTITTGLDSIFRSFMDSSGLLVIAFATGGIKPCVSAFAADQFAPDQHTQRSQFFSFFYFAINAGALLAIFTTPILRSRVKCFGSDYCFPLAFGVPGALMFGALILFVAGWKTYKKSPADKGNVVWKVFQCIFIAAKRKITSVVKNTKNKDDQIALHDHWLDYASPTIAPSIIVGVKSLVAVSILFGPVVLFWSLFSQQGSTWIHQARRMNGRIGNVTLLPDQMNTLNPLLIIILVPIFEGIIYPLFRRFKINPTPLRKMSIGGILAAIAFVIAGLVQLRVSKTIQPLPPIGNIFLTVVGTDTCNNVTIVNKNDNSMSIAIESNQQYSLLSSTDWHIIGNNCNIDTHLNLSLSGHGYMVGYFSNILKQNDTPSIEHFSYPIEKADNGRTRIYILVDNSISSEFIGKSLYAIDTNGNINNQHKLITGAHIDILPPFIGSNRYRLTYGSSNCNQLGTNTNSSNDDCIQLVESFDAQMGAVYAIVIDGYGDATVIELINENSVSLLWQLPQYFCLTVGEVLFSVTGLEFSYSQATSNMKSVMQVIYSIQVIMILQALWLMTVFFGNIIAMSISGTHIISDASTEFFLYALLMLAVMCLFMILATRYEYVKEDDQHQQSIDLVDQNKNNNN